MEDKQIFLDTALKIADRIVNNAIWDGSKCTWKIYAPDMSAPKLKKGKWETAGGTVYQGVSGIILFLAEISRYNNEEKIIKVIDGAVNYSCEESNKLQFNAFGFYSGRVGVAYALTLVGTLLKKEDYIQNAKDILLPLVGKENEDYGLDVIGGAAGAIPALLKINEFKDNVIAVELAFNLAESLIQKANMEPHGWSWGGGNSNYRNLCGYAHGTSGVGHAFLELYNYTDSTYYLYAAEQAFLYERQFYNNEYKNWPDFRYTELSEYTAYNLVDELKEILKKNALPPYQIHYMSAWCHGAPGIGLSRLRAYELTNQDLYKKEALNSCENIIGTCENQLGNYSLCHGILGNCETLLFGSVLLNEKKYFDIAFNKAIEGIERFENKSLPWPCGTMGSIPDPSFMLGESGIGHFLLRMFDNNIPSALCVKSNKKNKVKDNAKDDFSLRRNYIETYFGKTLSLIDLIEGKENLVVKSNNFSIDHFSGVETICSILETYIPSSVAQYKDKLEDCFILEKEKYLLSKNIDDFTKEFLHKLNIEIKTRPNWELSEFILSDDCKVLTANYNWKIYKANNPSIENVIEEETYYLLFRTENKIKLISINHLLYVILSSAEKPINFSIVIKRITSQFEISGSQKKVLNEKVKEQLNYAYKNGLIRIMEF